MQKMFYRKYALTCASSPEGLGRKAFVRKKGTYYRPYFSGLGINLMISSVGNEEEKKPRSKEKFEKHLIEKEDDQLYWERLQIEDFLTIVRKYFKEIKWEIGIAFLDLMLKYGAGELKGLADELGLSIKEARTIKQRIKRNIDRLWMKFN